MNVALLCGLLCSGGAVFSNAAAFNGDLSKWNVGAVTLMFESTYTLSLLTLRSALFVGVRFLLSFFWCALM